MKKIFTFLICAFVIISCKNEKQKSADKKSTEIQKVQQKIIDENNSIQKMTLSRKVCKLKS
ncbi:hypothetical protein VT569_04945 [Flavobacterium psychrophilum]|uniref:hypothetical protein n=1 Tax=Flavobacterium psychrophilum TaxID=96345 RepID=UPI003B437655